MPLSLVVKNGLKMRSVNSAGTPGPLSATSTMTIGVGRCGALGERRVRLDRRRATRVIVIAPLPSSASKALAIRLVNTWQS